MKQDFGKVAVLMGGFSSEREVSLNSGKAIMAAMQRLDIDATAIDVGEDIYTRLQTGQFDRVFNILHGRGGEDGQIQALLEFMHLPYTGSGIAASAIAMDKLQTKKIWHGEGLPTPNWKVLCNDSDCQKAIEDLGLPLIVKPVLEGSSVGVSKVKKADEIVKAWQTAKQYGVVIAEQFIDGGEYTVSILHEEVLPTIRLEPAKEFYDYEAKYLRDDTKYHCPAGLSDELEQHCQQLAMQAFKAIGTSGWGRVDFMLDKKQQPFLIELNTVPGMTDHSLVPMAAKQAGINFEELVLSILNTTNESK